MIFSPPLSIVLLSAGAAWATQAPLAAASSGGSCLSMSSSNHRAAYQMCCGGESKSGKGSVDGVEFTYACGKWATGSTSTAIQGISARECAKRCAADTNCPASSWTSSGNCYFVTASVYESKTGSNYLFIEKTGQIIDEPEPQVGCEKPVEAAKAHCDKEAAAKCEKAIVEKCGIATTAALEQSKVQCEQEKTALASSCAETKKNADAQCKTEQAALIESGKAQCEQEKANLIMQIKSQCESDKAAQSSACEAAKAALEAEKHKLQNALDEANQKLKETGTGTTAGSSVSTTSPENEALVEEISRESFSTICAKFRDRKFITIDSQGYKREWVLRCNVSISYLYPTWLNYKYPCHTQDIIRLIKEEQDNRDFRGLWVNHVGYCTPAMGGGSVSAGSRFDNHHLVLPTREPWK